MKKLGYVFSGALAIVVSLNFALSCTSPTAPGSLDNLNQALEACRTNSAAFGGSYDQNCCRSLLDSTDMSCCRKLFGADGAGAQRDRAFCCKAHFEMGFINEYGKGGCDDGYCLEKLNTDIGLCSRE